MFQRRTLNKEIAKIHEELAQIHLEIKYLRDQDRDLKQYSTRLADLEVKMMKLWDLAMTSTPKGKDRLTEFGKRRFGGALQR